MSGLRLFPFSFAFVCIGAVLAQPTFPEGIDEIVSGIGERLGRMKLPEGCSCCVQFCWKCRFCFASGMTLRRSCQRQRRLWCLLREIWWRRRFEMSWRRSTTRERANLFFLLHLTAPCRLHIQLFTAASSSAFIREVALANTALAVLLVLRSSDRALLGSLTFVRLFSTGWGEASEVCSVFSSKVRDAYFNFGFRVCVRRQPITTAFVLLLIWRRCQRKPKRFRCLFLLRFSLCVAFCVSPGICMEMPSIMAVCTYMCEEF